MTRITQYVSLGIGMWVVGSSGIICGCSSSSNSNPGNGNPTTFTSSVDASKQLGALTTAEMQQLCRDTLTYQASQITPQQKNTLFCLGFEAVAIAQAMTNGTDPSQACHTAYTQCQSMSLGVDAGTSSNNCNTATVLAGCTATVSQFNQCTQDEMAATKAAISTLGPQICDEMDAGMMSTPATPASCTAIKQACPSFTTPGS
jgi:hypothetical protein